MNVTSCPKCNNQEMQRHAGLAKIAREEYERGSYPKTNVQHDILIDYVMICPACGFTEIYSKLREELI